MLETASAANPSAAAIVDAVTGSSLLRNAMIWCSPSVRAGLLIEEARVQIGQRGERGDHDRERHERRHDREREAEQVAGARSRARPRRRARARSRRACAASGRGTRSPRAAARRRSGTSGRSRPRTACSSQAETTVRRPRDTVRRGARESAVSIARSVVSRSRAQRDQHRHEVLADEPLAAEHGRAASRACAARRAWRPGVRGGARRAR